MLKSTLSEAVERSVGTTMETMAFEQAIPTDTEFACEEEANWAELSILAPYYGMMTLQTCSAGASLLMELVHGPQEDEELPPEILFDTFAELINTLGGRFMSELVADDVSFKLGLPQTGRGKMRQRNDVVYSQVFQIDEILIHIMVSGAAFKEVADSATDA